MGSTDASLEFFFGRAIAPAMHSSWTCLLIRAYGVSAWSATSARRGASFLHFPEEGRFLHLMVHLALQSGAIPEQDT